MKQNDRFCVNILPQTFVQTFAGDLMEKTDNQETNTVNELLFLYICKPITSLHPNNNNLMAIYVTDDTMMYCFFSHQDYTH